MNEQVGQETHPAGRSLRVGAAGDTVAEMEMAALDEARKFFGADVHLMIVADYQAYPPDSSSIPALRDSGKRYCAHMTVRTVEH